MKTLAGLGHGILGACMALGIRGSKSMGKAQVGPGFWRRAAISLSRLSQNLLSLTAVAL